MLDKSGSSKEDKKAKATVSRESEAMSKMDRNAKKKKEKVIKRAKSDSEGEHVDKEISNQLLHLSVKSYKRLLVSADSEVMWYDQVSLHYSICTWEQDVNFLFAFFLAFDDTGTEQ